MTNVIKEIVTLEDIYEAYYVCRKNKRSKPSAIKFELHYEKYLRQLYNDLNNGTYTISKSIVFGISRPKKREVFAADFRDRIVHHLLMLRLEPILETEMIDTSYNCRVNKGTTYGINTLYKQIKTVSNNYTKQTFVLQCDIQGFFMSINKEILWKHVHNIMFKKWTLGNLEWWLDLTKQIIMHRPELFCDIHGNKSILDNLPDEKTLFRSNGKGLPIGNLTSQIFGNYYLTPFDNWIKEEIGENMEYGRYVDDFYIVGCDKKRMLRLLPKIREQLKTNFDLTLHPRKVSITDVKKGISFIGCVIKPWGIYNGNRTITNAFNVLKRYKKGDSIEDLIQTINSYFGFMVGRLSYGIRWNYWKAICQKTNNLVCINMKKVSLKNHNHMNIIH